MPSALLHVSPAGDHTLRAQLHVTSVVQRNKAQRRFFPAHQECARVAFSQIIGVSMGRKRKPS